MKTKLIVPSLFLSGILLTASAAFAEGEAVVPAVPMEEAAAPAVSPEMQAMMQKFQEAGTPAEGHKALEPLVGSWTASVKFWMAPDAPPMEESIGSSEAQWILGGRFIEQKFTGTSMGRPFNGIWITGFDNIAKKYQTIWLDDMSTGMMVGNGSYDAATKTMMDTGSFSCPMTWGERTYRSSLKWTSDTSYTYEMYMVDPATEKEFKGMEIVYTKKA